MFEYTHGGDVYGRAETLLDFSANLNPLGMPPAVRRAAEEAVGDAARYPDALCRDLTAAIARRDGVPPGWVLCGNGAADLIFRLAFALRPGRALVTAPTFSEYAQALGAAGCAVTRHTLRREDGFDLTEDVLDALDGDLDLAFFCTPNNPTGRMIDPALLSRILARCAGRGITLAVDECFLELTQGAGLTGVLEEYPNLILFRAFTKSYAMPGLRLGYCLCAGGGLLERLWGAGQPWSVSAPAQAAGLAALRECPDWPGRARALLAVERPRLADGLRGLGLEVIPGEANYLLFRAPGVTDLKERLLERGVLIRACANYPGLGPDDYRTAVRTAPENDILLEQLREVL